MKLYWNTATTDNAVQINYLKVYTLTSIGDHIILGALFNLHTGKEMNQYGTRD
jgi:hypothetical protein